MARRRQGAASNGRLRARRRIWVFSGLALLAIVTAAFVAVRPQIAVSRSISHSEQTSAVLHLVTDAESATAHFQIVVEPALSASLPGHANLILAEGFQASQVQLTQLQSVLKALPAIGRSTTAAQLRTLNDAFIAAYGLLAPLADGASPLRFAAPISVERSANRDLLAGLAATAALLQTTSNSALQAGAHSAATGRTVGLVVAGLAALLALITAGFFGQVAHHRERADRRVEQRQLFATSLQEALDMSKMERDVYGIVRKASRSSLPHLQMEMLVADSSRAHFHKVFSTGDDGPSARNGCGVVSPLDCPAAVRGHTLVFETSAAINACPNLQDRPSGDLSAACIPISIEGTTTGVTHATGPAGVPPTAADVEYLEIASRRASERITLLRALEKSETQAASDPLTGLWNRRSLDNQVRDLQLESIPYALAYGDLDHFKRLNDTYGHESGDQALRLFSRVLRDSVRPNDIAARYGGEEFVIVLPDCDIAAAIAVLERVRENLALALTNGPVAIFTVTFGLTHSNSADTFGGVVAAADRALLAAKAAGRNRVVVAVESVGRNLSIPTA